QRSREQEVWTGYGDAARDGAGDGKARARRDRQSRRLERDDRVDEARTGSQRDWTLALECADGEQVWRARSAAQRDRDSLHEEREDRDGDLLRRHAGDNMVG